MTSAEYTALLASCNFREPNQVSELVTATHTNVMFNEKVEERQVNNALGAYNYFSGLFNKEVWQDGQGNDIIREYYAEPYIPFSFNHFVRQSAICDPNLANECNTDYCQIPEGGRGTLPGQVFFKWGFETPRDCIANIRSIRQFQWWASRVIRSRELTDEQVMNMFYTMAAIQTAGHKITMQGVRGADGTLKLAPSSNPRNPLRGGLYNFMEERFPSPSNLNNIAPLTVGSMEGLARYWSQFPKGNEVATTSRGAKVWEFWYPDDWYATEALRDPDYMEKIKLTMPANLFPGFSSAPGEREIVGNWAPKVMPFLPRFAPTADGKIVPVDSHVGIDIEVNKEFVGSADFENAPFGIAGIVSGKQGTILTRPPLTASGAGFPIMPITGDGPWRIRNDYDKDCNKDLNQPYSQKRYEMGMRMDDPEAALFFLFRRRVFQQRPINECDLAPIFTIEERPNDCAITSIGCNGNGERVTDDITGPEGMTRVSCTSMPCGDANSTPFAYVLKIERKANMPDYNSLGCECGSNVKLFVYDENGVYVKEITGIYKSSIQSFPEARVFVETTIALTAGQCIKGISCADSDILQGNVLDAFEILDEAGETQGVIGFLLDDSIRCKATDDVLVTYYDANGAILGTVTGIIDLVDLDRFYYQISSISINFKAVDAFAGQFRIGVTCTEAGVV